MDRKNVSAVVTVALLALVGWASAVPEVLAEPPKGTFTGYVLVRAKNKPQVAGAQVEVWLNGNLIHRGTTGGDGKIAVPKLRYGVRYYCKAKKGNASGAETYYRPNDHYGLTRDILIK